MSLSPGDEWALAEVASGFTLSNKLSPWHGAMLASAAVNNGIMVRPHIVRVVTDESGLPLYTHETRKLPPSISPESARKLRRLMRETVRRGSARKGFRGFFRGEFENVEVGGKTGSLTGTSPKGRNDWFVGYASLDERKIAFASLTVNEERWTVKSAFVARKVIEAYFRSEE
jgi:cell division protein FtsI/penicillin-binding protein 2